MNKTDYGCQFPFLVQRILARCFPGFRRYLAKQEQLTKEAHYDPLTQLSNRRAARELFDRELKLLLREDRRRGGIPVTAVFIDLDGFKAVNDTLGHEAGDAVLVHVATLLSRSFRATDIICRKGGDEFIIFLINAEEEQALKHVRGLFETIQKDENLVFETKHRTLKVTASIGVASSHVRSIEFLDESWQLFLKRADEAMYASKASGRNAIKVVQVTSFGTFE